MASTKPSPEEAPYSTLSRLGVAPGRSCYAALIWILATSQDAQRGCCLSQGGWWRLKYASGHEQGQGHHALRGKQCGLSASVPREAAPAAALTRR